MRDYLSDLVTKNIGTADLIEPRRSARFEPIQTRTALEAEIEPSFQADVFEEEGIIELPALTRPRRRREVRSTEKSEEISSLKNADDQIEQRLTAAPTETHSSETGQMDARTVHTPKIIEATREPISESLFKPNLPLSGLSAPITSMQSPPKSAVKPEISNNTAEHAPIQTHRAPLTETDNSKISPPGNFDQHSIEANAPIIIEPRVEKAETGVEETTIHQIIIPLAQEQMSKQISERAAIPETPVINVTIGRVEIRAAVSSAPPKQSPAKPQTLSLDEYLRKRRNGGER